MTTYISFARFKLALYRSIVFFFLCPVAARYLSALLGEIICSNCENFIIFVLFSSKYLYVSKKCRTFAALFPVTSDANQVIGFYFFVILLFLLSVALYDYRLLGEILSHMQFRDSSLMSSGYIVPNHKLLSRLQR